MASHLTTLRRAGFAAALMAGSALVAPSDAWAVGDMSATNNALSTHDDFVAPFTTSPQFRMGRKIKIGYTTSGANAGNLRLTAIFYNSSDTTLGAQNLGVVAPSAAGLKSWTGTLSNVNGATKVAFLVSSDAADTIATALNAAAVGVLNFNGATNNDVILVAAAVATGVMHAGGDISALSGVNQGTIGDAITTAETTAGGGAIYRLPLSTDYDFVAQSANKAINGSNTSCVYVTFNAYTAATVDGAAVTGGMTVAAGATTIPSFGTDDCGANGVAPVNTSKSAKFDGDALATPANFSGLIDTVTFAGGAVTGGAVVTDAAGNNPVAATITSVPTLTTPSFATSGTAKGILTLGGLAVNDSQASRVALYATSAGTGFTSANGAVTVTLRLAETVTNFDAVDDLSIPATVDTFGNATTGSNAISFTVQPAAGAATALRVCGTDGKVYTQPVVNPWNSATCAGTGATALSIDLKTGASALTTSLGALPLGGAVGTVMGSPVNVYVGTPLGITSIATTDIAGGTPDGSIDGVSLTFGNPITGASAGSGIELVGRTALTTAVTGGTTITPAAPTAATVITAVATVPGNLTAGAHETLGTDGVNVNNNGDKKPPYAVRITGTPTWTYTNVYKTTDGTATLPIETLTGAQSITSDLPYSTLGTGITDGVAPWLLSATRLTGSGANSGEFRLVFSEAMTNLAGATNRNNDIQTNTTSTLGLDVLNFGVGTPLIGLLASDTTSKTVRIYGVDNSVINATGNIGISAANQSATNKVTAADAATNLAATRVVNLGSATALPDGAAPTVLNASAIIDANNKVTNILVFFNKPITLTGSSVQTDFTFDVDPGTGTWDVTGVGFASASAGSGSNNYVLNLAVPGSGITLQNLEAGQIRLNYTSAPSNFVSDTVTPPNNMAATDLAPIAVQLPRNSTRTFTQEIRGKITTDGTTAVEQGTIVRADLVNFSTDGTTITTGTVSVPFTTPGNVTTVRTGVPRLVGWLNFDELYQALSAQALTGASSLTAYLGTKVIDANGNFTLTLGTTAANAGSEGTTVYPVSINTSTGAITSQTPGIIGTFPFVPAPAIKTLVAYNQGGIKGAVVSGEGPTAITTASTYVPAYGVVGTSGNYRLNVGSNTSRPGAFVIISVKRPNSATWTQISSADPTFVNFLPFNKDKTTVGITTGTGNTATTSNPNTNTTDFGTSLGANGTTVNLNIRLDRILSSAVPNYAGWEVVGLTGELARNTPLSNFETRRFLTTIKTDSGAPFSNWYQKGGTLDPDSSLNEAFVLNANSVASSFEMTSGNQIDNIKGALAAGNGIALKGQIGGATIFYPVSSLTAAPKNLAAGWHLLTAQASNGSPATFGGTSAPNQKVGMVIQAGGGSQAKTWIADAATNSTVVTNNTLTALIAGQAYFVYLTAPVTGFTFQ